MQCGSNGRSGAVAGHWISSTEVPISMVDLRKGRERGGKADPGRR